jgi:hypothetical protein
MSSFYVHLPPEAAERLRELARCELRSPARQATILVLAGLARDAEATAQREPPAGVPARRVTPTTEHAR